jgi:hypothetical protein
MRIIAGALIAAALAFGSGCAKTDWIEQTLVTVDVTGTWSGSFQGAGAYATNSVSFQLEQQGSTVKGYIRVSGGDQSSAHSGPIDGTVSGDVFRFKNARGSTDGTLTISGDEMNGEGSFFGPRRMSLRRIESPSRPASPPR